MATTNWTGAANDSFTNASNWDNGVPGAGDVAIINATAIDIPAVTYGTTFGELRIGQNFTGSIGGSGTSWLDITCTELHIDTGAKLRIGGTVSSKVSISSTASADDAVALFVDTSDLIILGARGTVTCGAESIVSGNDFSADVIEYLGNSSSKLVMNATCQYGGTILITDGTFDMVSSDGTVGGTLQLMGGTFNLYGGDLDATVKIFGGATAYDRRTANATLDLVQVYDGTWDGRFGTADVLTFGQVDLFEDGTFDERTGLLNYEYTTGVVFEGAGTFLADVARELTQS